MPHALCCSCAEEEHFSKLIEKTGALIECTVCHRIDNPALTAHEIGDVLGSILPEIYYHEEDENKGDELAFIVQEAIGLDLPDDFFEDVVEAAVDTEFIAPGDPLDGSFYHWGGGYTRQPADVIPQLQLWNSTLEQLKHSRRFFSDAAQTLFQRLFADVENMTVLGTLSDYVESSPRKPRGKREKIVMEMHAGTELFRARICDPAKEFPTWYGDPLKHVGPPPNDKARQGRMNAEGVAVLYCATDHRSALAEMRPGLATGMALIKLRTTRPLRILDFARLEVATHQRALSVFHPNYRDEVGKRLFLAKIHRLISKPIAPGGEAAYLITQTMAEYLSHIIVPRFDGISFSSAQRRGGKNIVIFGEQAVNEPSEKKFDIEYVAESIQYFSTSGIEYEHEERQVLVTPKGKVGVIIHDEFFRDVDDDDDESIDYSFSL